MASSPTLLGLPAELQIEIAKELDDRGLIAFHRICRELTASTIDVFAERFFEKRSHLYTSHALGRLRDISNVPAFARHIKSLELIIVKIELKDWYIGYRNFYPPATDAARRWYDAEKSEMRRSGHKYLAQIFANLKRRGSGRELKLTANLNLWTRKREDALSYGRSPDWNSSGLQKALPQVYGLVEFLSSVRPWAISAEVRAGDIDLACQHVFAALIRTGHHLEVLDLGYRSAARLTNHEAFNDRLTGWKLTSLSAVWSNLKVLGIGLETPIRKPQFSLLLRSATRLTHLCLDSVHPHNLECIGRDTQRHQLSSIAINGMSCDFFAFVRFIASQAKTLKHLQLSRVTLETVQEPWHRFFDIASKYLNLRSIEYFELDRKWGTHSLLQDDRFFARGSKSWVKRQLRLMATIPRWPPWRPDDEESEDESAEGQNDEVEAGFEANGSSTDQYEDASGNERGEEAAGKTENVSGREAEEGNDQKDVDQDNASDDEASDERSHDLDKLPSQLPESWTLGDPLLKKCEVWFSYVQGKQHLSK